MDELHKAIDAIYKIKSSEHTWCDALNQISRAVGTPGATLISYSKTEKAYAIQAKSNFCAPNVIEDYVQNFSTYDLSAFRRLSQLPERQLHCDSKLWPGEDFLERADYKFLKKYVGIQQRTGAVLRNETATDIFALQIKDKWEPTSSLEKHVLQPLLLHLERSIALQDILGQSQLLNRCFTEALDRIPLPIGLIDHSKRFLYKNKQMVEAIKKQEFFIQDPTGRVRLYSLDTDRALSDKLTQTANMAITDTSPTLRFTLHRRNHHPAALLEVLPAGFSFKEFFSRIEHVFLCIIFDPDTKETISGDRFGAIFELTPAEIEVCSAIFNGLSNNDIAEHRNVSVETIKKQCRAIFQKAAVRNRAELFLKAARATLTAPR